MFETIGIFLERYGQMLWQGTLDTLVMTLCATFFAYLIGLPIGTILQITKKNGICEHPMLYRVLSWLVNIGRSLPFIILMVLVMPVTKAVMGTKLGVRGAIFPLVIAAAPFVARMVESSLAELNAGVIEAARAMGASRLQIISRFYLPESLPSLLRGASISLITVLAYTAIAGAVGAGGLGDIAIRYGYNRYQFDILLVTVILLIILVEIMQTVFHIICKKVDKRRSA